MVVDIFIPCFIDQIYPETGMNMVKILEKIGLEVHYNPNQTCCGQSAYNNGFWAEAKVVGEKFIKDLFITIQIRLVVDNQLITTGSGLKQKWWVKNSSKTFPITVQSSVPRLHV